jgi:hypothetical protein
MPQPNYPPGPGVTQPRHLIRWLDVNYQGGQLTRTQSYITIPTFSFASNWNQVSDIIAAYWYLAPNNISLIAADTILDDIGYVFCVMYIEDDIVYRYKLNNDYRAIMPDFPMYTDQVIKKKFRIEIWNCDVQFTTVAPAIRIYTSKLGNVDYRYGDDFTLVNPLTVQTNFQTPNLDLPLVFPNQLYFN